MREVWAEAIGRDGRCELTGPTRPLYFPPTSAVASRNQAHRVRCSFVEHKKKRPRYRGHHKEAREGGKVREGDARSHSKNWNDQKGEVERIGRGLKSFSVVRPLLLLYSKALARPK